MKHLRVVVLALTAAAGCQQPLSPVSPCAEIDCGAGRCVLDDGAPRCVCNAGFAADRLRCVAEAGRDACAPNPCVFPGRTVCAAAGAVPVCSCAPGFVERGGACVPLDPCSPNPCSAPNQSRCSPSDGAARCECDAGYEAAEGGCRLIVREDCSKQHAEGDKFEPDECPELARRIHAPSVREYHSLAPAGDVDWFVLATVPGTIYRVEVESLDAAPLVVELFDPRFPSPLDSTSESSSGDVAVRATGEELLLRVAADQAGVAMGYSVRASLVTDDHPDGSTVTSLPPGSRNGALQFRNDHDVVAFDAVPLHVYRLSARWTRPRSELLTIELLGLENSVLDAASGTSPRLDHRGTTAGRVAIAVSAADGRTTGEWHLSIEELGPDDHGGSPESATLVGSGQLAAKLERRGDTDFFEFVAPDDGWFEFQCRTASLPVCALEVYDEHGAVLGGAYAANAAVGIHLVPGQRVFARSTTPEGTGSYTLSVASLGRDDHGEGVQGSSKLGPGLLASGLVQGSTDRDWFEVPVVAHRIYRLTCRGDAGLRCRVLDAAGAPLAGRGHGTSEHLWKANEGGTLYAEVLAATPVAYTVQLEDLGTDDHPDTAGSATAVAADGSTLAGTFETLDDRDLFAFVVHEPRSYLQFSCAPSCNLTVRDSAGVEVPSGVSARLLYFPSAGHYTVEVSPHLDLGAYALSIALVAADDAPADQTQAPTVGPGTHALHWEVPGDQDVFRLLLERDHTYLIRCNTVAPAKCRFQVRGPDPKYLSDLGGKLAVRADTDEAWIYVWNQDGQAGSYELSIVDGGTLVPGPTPELALRLTADASASWAPQHVVTSSGEGGSTGHYVVDGIAGHVYKFASTFPSGYHACHLKVLLGGSTLFSNWGSITFESKGEPIDLRTGPCNGDYTWRFEDLGTDDHRDSAEQATPFTLGSTLSAQLEAQRDRDAFVYSAVAGHAYRYAISLPIHSKLWVDLDIVDDAGQSLVPQPGRSGELVTSQSGPVYFIVYDRDSDTHHPIGYALEVVDLGPNDAGHDASSASPLPPGLPVQRVLARTGERDWFSFDAPAASRVRLSCVPPVGATCMTRVIDGFGQVVTLAGTAASHVREFDTWLSDTYRVEVYGDFTGAYALKVEVVP